MTYSLHSVSVEDNAVSPAYRSDLPYWLDGPDLVVGCHYGHQAGVVFNGFLYLFRSHKSILMYIQKSHLEAFLLKPGQCVEHRVMLKGRRDDVLLSLFRSDGRCGNYGLIVSFRPSGCENDLSRLGIDHLCHRLPGLFKSFLGFLTYHI